MEEAGEQWKVKKRHCGNDSEDESQCLLEALPGKGLTGHLACAREEIPFVFFGRAASLHWVQPCHSLKGHLWQCLGILFMVTTRMRAAIGIWWVEARDASKHLTAHSSAPASKDYQFQNVSRAGLGGASLALGSLSADTRVSGL